MRRVAPTAYAALFLLSCLPSIAFTQEKKPDVLDKKDTRVEPTHKGDVLGRIYDARSGEPIKKALVVIQQDGAFADKGETTGNTDDLGGYKARAILGRVSSNVDVGRLLLSSPLGLLFGSATNTTKRIDVARLNIRVSAVGYKSFEGPVVARAQDAGGFKILMEPILLVPDYTKGVSTSASGWGAVRINKISVEPPIAKPGDKVKLRAWVSAFGEKPEKTVEVKVFSDLWKNGKGMKFKGSEEGGTLFEAEHTISRGEKRRAEVIFFTITKSTLDVSPVRNELAHLLQIASTPEEEEAAKSRSAALDDLGQGRQQDAAGKFLAIAGKPVATLFDFRYGGDLHERLSDYGSALELRRAAVGSKTAESYDVEDYVRTLHLAGKHAEIPTFIDGLAKRKPKIKMDDESAEILAGYLGLAYVNLGDFEGAEKVNATLNKSKVTTISEAVTEFRNAYRMAKVEKAVRENPTDAFAVAEYGRALMDVGRFEESVLKLQEALKLDPKASAVKRDLTWAALHVSSGDVQAPPLDEALAEAEAALNIGQGKQESKDFYSWKQYALLLYTKAKSLATPEEATPFMDKSINALRTALSVARTGARHKDGHQNLAGAYLTGSEVSIAGFAYPEANSCFVLLDSLKVLRAFPDDYLAHFNLATALVDLGQPKLAQVALTRVEELKPEYAEARFLSALLALQLKDDAGAKAQLLAVLELNPRHPRANLILSDILARDGDVAGAAASMAAHSQWYGETMRT